MACAHLDVVPVEHDKWTVPPFEGLVRDGYVYGRGTIDVKDSLMVILEGHFAKSIPIRYRSNFRT